MAVEIEAVYAFPEYQYKETLLLPDGSSVADALEQLRDRPGFAEIYLASAPVGVFGEEVAREHELRDGDRLEIYRPLKVDPMTARRQRAEEQKRRGAD